MVLGVGFNTEDLVSCILRASLASLTSLASLASLESLGSFGLLVSDASDFMYLKLGML